MPLDPVVVPGGFIQTALGTGRLAKSSNYNVVLADRGYVIDCTSTLTLTLDPAATLGAGFTVVVMASGSSVVVTIDPNGTETIRSTGGVSQTMTLYAGQSVALHCTGSGFEAIAGFSSGIGAPSRSVGVNTTLSVADHGRTIFCNDGLGGAITITTPSPGSATAGLGYCIANSSTAATPGVVTVAAAGGFTIFRAGIAVASFTLSYGQSAWIFHTTSSGFQYVVLESGAPQTFTGAVASAQIVWGNGADVLASSANLTYDQTTGTVAQAAATAGARYSITNTSATGAADVVVFNDTSKYVQYACYGSAFPGTFPGTSIALANLGTFRAGSGPLLINTGVASPIYVVPNNTLVETISDTLITDIVPRTTNQQIASTLATGTPPLAIASTTLVPNLYVARAVIADSVSTGAATNLLINGSFRVCQRSDPTTQTTVTSNTYGPDRWLMCSENANLKYDRLPTPSPSYYGRFTKTTSVGKMLLCQYIENYRWRTIGAYGVAQSVTFQIALRTDSARTFKIAIVGIDPNTVDTLANPLVTAWGANTVNPTFTAVNQTTTLLASTSCAVTAAGFTTFSVTTTVNSSNNTQNLAVMVWSDSQLGANAELHTMSAALYVSAAALTFTPEPIAAEVAECQRFYWKNFPLDTPVSQFAGLLSDLSYFCHVAGVKNDGFSVRFPVSMRATPTVTLYNPAAANSKWRNVTSAADSGASSSASASADGVVIINAQAAGDATGDRFAINASAEAELGL